MCSELVFAAKWFLTVPIRALVSARRDVRRFYMSNQYFFTRKAVAVCASLPATSDGTRRSSCKVLCYSGARRYFGTWTYSVPLSRPGSYPRLEGGFGWFGPPLRHFARRDSRLAISSSPPSSPFLQRVSRRARAASARTSLVVCPPG